MKASQIIETDDYASFPAIAEAMGAIERADSREALGAARDALRKAELQRDIALGFTDLWGDYERELAAAFSLI